MQEKTLVKNMKKGWKHPYTCNYSKTFKFGQRWQHPKAAKHKNKKIENKKNVRMTDKKAGQSD